MLSLDFIYLSMQYVNCLNGDCMGWFENSKEQKAKQCNDCQKILSKYGNKVNICNRCGHLYYKKCNCY